jgi:hypothetical protein
MKHVTQLVVALSTAAFALAAFAQTPAPKEKKEDGHKKETTAQHRAMARAHEDAAKCLESGKAEKECHAKLQEDCKGLGIGKYCGMRHTH